MKNILIILAVLLFSVNVEASVKTKIVEYKQGDATLEGYLAWDDAKNAKRPGVLVVHEWTGINDHIRQRTEMLAKLGYVAFAADIYGKGIRPTAQAEAAKTAGIYKDDRPLLRARARAGLEVLKKQKLVDPQRIAAIGYCFGGTTVLELARDAADLKGVVSFHGGLSTPTPQDAKNIKAKLLVLHGADDPFVNAGEVAAFQDEMRKGGVDWQFISYSNAVHSFTNKAAGTDNSKGAAYNEKADRRSWQAMRTFFAEIFK
ncbi:MAG: dienelactone hydrolase family protein [Steroidobacteraceae bacterium]|nr:dienelactone hydrolase family protein [Deltaproteobacteria bacterium]